MGGVCIHRRLVLPELTGVIFRGETVGVLAFQAFDVDTWDNSGVNRGVEKVGTRLQVVAGSHNFFVVIFL